MSAALPSPEDLPYADPPAGFADPCDEASRLEAVEHVQLALLRLRNPADRALVAALFGIATPPIPLPEYARQSHISRRKAYYRLAAALQQLTRYLPKP